MIDPSKGYCIIYLLKDVGLYRFCLDMMIDMGVRAEMNKKLLSLSNLPNDWEEGSYIETKCPKCKRNLQIFDVVVCQHCGLIWTPLEDD